MTELKDTTKSYPATTPEIAQMFGMSLEGPKKEGPKNLEPPVVINRPVQAPEIVAQAKDSQQIGAISNLKIPKNPRMAGILARHEAAPAHPSGTSHEPTGASTALPGQIPPVGNVIKSRVFTSLKAVAPYVAVFSAALLVYFYFFSGSGINFGSISQNLPKASLTPKENSLASVEKQDLAGYQTWINQFYYDVSDAKILDPEADNSGNGLSNFQKYLLNLNPKSYDTLGLGMADSQALNSGIDPLTGGPLTDSQKSILAQYVDMEVVMNRLALQSLQKSGEVAGANTLNSPNNMQSGSLTYPLAQSASAGLTPAPSANTGGNLQAQSSPNSVVPSDLGNGLDVDTSIPGRLDIPSLKISAPLTWSADSQSFDKDLQSGVIHYPGTALPGEIGTTYIAGHSSNYVWAKGSYNHVFTHLGDLADNTSFSITVTLKGGKTAIYHYVVTGRQQYSPTDPAQFANGSKSVVALSTCWPVGSTAKRLVVFGTLTQVEQ